MDFNVKSIRSFIGAKDFDTSRNFYREFGFEEVPIASDMSYFRLGKFGFYLQQYYVKNWVNNSMIFLEVEDLSKHYEHIQELDLTSKYKGVRLSGIKFEDWGNEFFLHDPSGVLWHIGEFQE